MTQGLRFLLAGRGQLKCVSTRAGTRLRLSAKRTSPFKSAGASVQSTAGSRGVLISGSNAGYTMFRGSVNGTGYLFHSPVSPFTSPPVRPCVPLHFSNSTEGVSLFPNTYGHFGSHGISLLNECSIHSPRHKAADS